jgi:peptidoglycan/xylan/chitin deacetylase (PgdA/CDA1 family)
MNDIIEQQTGKRTNIFRFPGGSSNTVSRGHSRGIMTTLSQVMQSEGYQYFDWNVDSNDAAGANSTQVYNNVIRGIKNTSKPVILMHDIKKSTLNALDDMLRYMTNNGYKFGTLDINGPIVHHGINN